MSIEFGEVNKYDQSSQFPVVDLVFTGPKRSLVDRVNGNAAQFTRNTIGTYVGADGLIKTAAAGEPRYTYDPATGEELGLLVEESRTNYLTNSSALHTWPIVFGPIVTANATTAPDGTITATSLVPASGQLNQIFLPNFDNKRNLSVFAKADGYDHIILVAQSNPSTSAGVLFSLSGSGNVVATNYGATGSIQQLANGWYRCTMTRSSTDTATMNTFIIRAADSSTPYPFNYFSQSSFVGDGTSGVYIWGAQHEEGSYPTSYIPTTTSTITRDPDTITLTNNNIYNKEKFDIINDPFGVSAGSDTLTLLPSAFNSSAIKRATVFSPNIAQSKINAFANKTDEFWKWRVTGDSFGLPTARANGSGVTLDIDWGDGTIENYTGVVISPSHTYTDGKEYHEIGFKLNGDGSFQPSIYNDATHRNKLIAIGPAPESMKIYGPQAFWGCANLIAFDATVNFGIVGSNFNRAWQDCTSLKSFPLINTSGVTNFSTAWLGCSGLTSFPLIDTSSGTDFSNAWNGCSSLTSFPLIDASSGTTFVSAWSNCSGLISFPLIDTSSGTTFQRAWYNCNSLTSFPTLDTSSGTNFIGTWENCSGLTTFPLINTSSGTNFAYAWQGCSSLTNFPEIDTSNGTDFFNAWNNCIGLTSFPLIDTSSGTNFTNAWRFCTSLTTFPLINTSSGDNFQSAWSNCSGLTSFPLINTSSGTNFAYAWYNCNSLTSFPLINTSSGTTFIETWRGCNQLTSFPLIDVSSGTNFSGAWRFCTSLTTFPANFFDSWTGTPANNCFVNTWDGCNSLTATSVENIYNSISVSPSSSTPPASGTNIDVDYSTGTGTPDITVSAIDLTAKGWTPTLNGVAQTDPYSFASLDLDFATNLTLNDNISNSNLITFTRGSTGTYVDSNGVIQTAAIDAPRFDHDPETLESLGLLVEEERTNLIPYSEQFDNATWFKFNATVTPNQALAPNGTLTMYEFTDNATNGTHYIVEGFTPPSSNFTISAYVKYKNIDWVYLKYFIYGCAFNIRTGEVGTPTANATSPSITPVGNGIYRISVNITNSVGADGAYLGLSTDDSINGVYTGTGSSAFIWGIQVEEGSFPTSYIPTSGSTETRAADEASITGSNFSSWYNQSEGTFLVSHDPTGKTGAPRLLGGGSVQNAWIEIFTSNNYNALRSNTRYNFLDSPDFVSGVPHNVAFAYGTTAGSSVDGQNYTVQGWNVTDFPESKLNIGRKEGGGEDVSGTISRLTYYPKRLPDIELQQLTK